MCEELQLKKLSSEAWGFRLTGGRDFGTPLTVLRVSGASVAEEGGMEVGDMIVSINGKCTQAMTHVEAQQHIIGSGNNLTLQILRGSPVPAPELTTTPLRGMTPNIGNQSFESELTNNSHDHVKFTESAFSHLQKFTHEAEPSDEDLEEKQIADKMLENAELLEGNVIGVNFKRFIPKVDFIKNSLVYQVLQEEQVYKAKTEEEQLEKTPEKRFSTFLVHPNNAKPKIKKEPSKLPKRPKTPASEPEPKTPLDTEKPKSEEKKADKKEDQPTSDQFTPDQPTTDQPASDQPKPKKPESEERKQPEEPKTDETNKAPETDPNIQVNDKTIQQEGQEETKNNPQRNSSPVLEESTGLSQENEEISKDSSGSIAPLTKQEILNAQQELAIIEEVHEETEEPTQDSEFNKQLVLIKNQLENLRQLPSLIETQLNLFQTQIDSLVELKTKEIKPNSSSQTEAPVSEPEKTEHTEAPESASNANSEPQSGAENDKPTGEPVVEPQTNDQSNSGETPGEQQRTGGGQDQTKEQQIEREENKERDATEPHHCTHTTGKVRPKKSSLFNGITPQPRPVVLPGGRIWRKPQDAYIDEFIAETLVTQAEVLIGTTTGVNFRKYEPPKFSMSESAVWRLINNIENNSSEVEPSLDFYQTPIDEKKIFVAGLHMNPEVESVVREVEATEALKNAPPVNSHHVEEILGQEPVSSF